MSETKILLVSSVAFLGGLCNLWLLGARLDSLGSKPVLTFSVALWLLVLAGWGLLAGQVVLPKLWIILLLQFFMGLLAAMITMSNTRLAMVIVPVMGRNHFFAIFSVLANVWLGVAPILWGLVIDAVGNWHAVWLGVEWNRYSAFFAAVAVVMLVTLVLSRQLEEPQAASMEELLRDILIQSPQRVWVRLWPRE